MKMRERLPHIGFKLLYLGWNISVAYVYKTVRRHHFQCVNVILRSVMFLPRELRCCRIEKLHISAEAEVWKVGHLIQSPLG